VSQLLVLSLDADVAGHLAVALRRHRSALRKNGLAEPPGLADLETAAVEVVSSTQQLSAALTVPTGAEDGLHDREFLSRDDIRRLSGVSLATVDRWLSSGQLPSRRHGRTRRITRADLDRFLSAA